MKHTTDKVAKYEAQIETYKKKLEELSDLRGQVKMLEDKNTSYMHKNMELEEVGLLCYKAVIFIYMNKYWLETSKETERAIALCCTGPTIVSILLESHQDLSVTEMFFWTCRFPLWCNSCCGDTRIVYKCCLHCSNVAKDSDVVSTNKSCRVFVNRGQGTRCMVDTGWCYSNGRWIHMGVTKHIFWIKCGFGTIISGKQWGWL